MRKGEPKVVPKDSTGWHSILECRGSRSCHTLLVRQPAHCRPAPPSPAHRAIHGRCNPGWFAPLRFRDRAPCATGHSRLRHCFPREGNSGGHAVGAWGRICARQSCRLKGKPLLTAKHLSADSVYHGPAPAPSAGGCPICALLFSIGQCGAGVSVEWSPPSTPEPPSPP